MLDPVREMAVLIGEYEKVSKVLALINNPLHIKYINSNSLTGLVLANPVIYPVSCVNYTSSYHSYNNKHYYTSLYIHTAFLVIQSVYIVHIVIYKNCTFVLYKHIQTYLVFWYISINGLS